MQNFKTFICWNRDRGDKRIWPILFIVKGINYLESLDANLRSYDRKVFRRQTHKLEVQGIVDRWKTNSQ